MKRLIQISLLVALAGVLIGLGRSFALAQAQSDGGYELIHGFIGNSGRSAGAGYMLVGSLDGGNAMVMSGGEFALAAEDAEAAQTGYRIHLPVVMR
jgi:hypothetical protein